MLYEDVFFSPIFHSNRWYFARDLVPPGDNSHRRLDREAALLTREAEADAHRWGDNSTLSSSAPRSPSSSPGHHGATTTVSYSSRFGDSSSGTRSSSNGEVGPAAQDSTSGLVNAVPASSRSGNVGGPNWRYRRGAGVTGGAAVREPSLGVGAAGGRGSASVGTGTGIGEAASTWDRELARTLAREGSAVPGWPSRWRPGAMPGSRAALGLWERAGGLDGDGDDDDAGGAGGMVNDGGVSSPGNVDTTREVSNSVSKWVKGRAKQGAL